jgi:hypothetical protein
MYSDSILQNFEEFLPKLEKISEEFFCNPQNVSDMVLSLKNSVLELVIAMIADNFNKLDEAICSSHNRKKNWNIVKKDKTSLLTSLGNVTYYKTLFINKTTGERCYLIDKLMGIEPHTRMTEDALAQIYEEAVDSSYEKGGLSASLTDFVSKQTVKNKIHEIVFPKETINNRKQVVKNLYIDADEDHVSLQFQNEKGDLEASDRGLKKNGCISKLIYVYEGKTSSGKRNSLKGTHYFSGVYSGSQKNLELWEEVNAYIQEHYEIEEGGHIFVNGDGGPWINRAEEVLGDKVVMILDSFHLSKYINQATSHMEDSSEDAKSALYKAIKRGNKQEVKKLFEKLQHFAVNEATSKRISVSLQYILGNWKKIKAANTYRNEVLGCSAEGHVSHILSARLSSRPLGWSKKGADRMSHLRAYKANGGNMLSLAKAQRTTVEVDRVKLEELYSGSKIICSEKEAKKDIEKYFAKFNRTLENREIRKMVYVHMNVADL